MSAQHLDGLHGPWGCFGHKAASDHANVVRADLNSSHLLGKTVDFAPRSHRRVVIDVQTDRVQSDPTDRIETFFP